MNRTGFLCLAVLTAISVGACANEPEPGTVQDEAMRAGLAPEHFVRPTPDYFHDMDFNLVPGGRKPLGPDAVAGRNMWMVWSGGNDRLWDRLTIDSLGTFDLLKTISSHPKEPGDTTYGAGYGRHNRWEYLGLVNEPCFKEATGPDPNRYGLWLDVRDPSCPPDPFADADTFPGVKIGARGKTVAVGSYYGEPTGIVGLRLFPNPDFDEKARRHWDADKFYNDRTYYFDRNLVRPYRVAMTCAFCHVGPNPIKPPDDPENPKWENLSSNVGAQYFWWDRIFDWRGLKNEKSLFYQALHVSRPGTLDTSLVSTDNINNPRTMNAVYYLGPRMGLARKWGRESLSGGGLNNRQFNNFVPPSDPLAQFFAPPSTTWTPRVLKDGADSVGALGALNRVYINIGLFSEEWLLHFRPVLGGRPISPIPLETAQKNSVYWLATELQTPNMARFFLASTEPHYLKDAPRGGEYLRDSPDVLRQGKLVFADRCARCHSSDIPELPRNLDLEGANGAGYLTAWNQYWAWTKTNEFKTQMRAKVLADTFLENNYLSTELRVPITVLGINACSPLATNAIRNNIWDNFSSESYKQLPSAGTIEIRDPRTGKASNYVLPAGGRGYIRPASLVSLWSTAPFLQNNTVGPFKYKPSVESRMESFKESIEQMLWPDRRKIDGIFGDERGPGVGEIDRLTVETYLEIPNGYLPPFLRGFLGLGRRFFPFLTSDNYAVRIGPFPKGFPVGLLTNSDMLGADLTGEELSTHRKNLLRLVKNAKRVLKTKPDLETILRELTDDMLALSKCKDFVVNKGHYFGTSYFYEETGLSDSDKNALIALLKTF